VTDQPDNDQPLDQDADLFDDDDASETITCPECGRDVYKLADRCPHCGHWMAANGGAMTARSTWVKVTVIVALVALLTWLFFHLYW
jgi:ribosomal protein L37E